MILFFIRNIIFIVILNKISIMKSSKDIIHWVTLINV